MIVDGSCLSFTSLHSLPFGDDKTEAGNALNTFIGTADKKIDTKSFHVDRNTSEAAHSINKKYFIMFFDNSTYFLDGIQSSGSSFAVNQSHMGYSLVFRKCLFKFFEIDLVVLVLQCHEKSCRY